MFDKLLDMFLDLIELFYFASIVEQYQQAVVLRFGKYNRTLMPGIHAIIPFHVEKVLKDNVVPRTDALGVQNLTTKDGITITVGGIVTSSIRDIEKALLGVEGVEEALADSCLGAIGTLIESATWEQIQQPDFSERATKICRKQAWRYGLEVDRVQFAHKSKTPAFYLHNKS